MAAKAPKAGQRGQNGHVQEAAGGSGEVLTLAEAAAFLRVADAEVLRLASTHALPGRRIGSEWRFLKAGLRDWLRCVPPRACKEAFLALAGAWHDDPDAEPILRDALQRRGRAEPERAG